MRIIILLCLGVLTALVYSSYVNASGHSSKANIAEYNHCVHLQKVAFYLKSQRDLGKSAKNMIDLYNKITTPKLPPFIVKSLIKYTYEDRFTDTNIYEFSFDVFRICMKQRNLNMNDFIVDGNWT